MSTFVSFEFHKIFIIHIGTFELTIKDNFEESLMRNFDQFYFEFFKKKLKKF